MIRAGNRALQFLMPMRQVDDRRLRRFVVIALAVCLSA